MTISKVSRAQRDAFMWTMGAVGLRVSDAVKLLRLASAHQRLSVDECNGTTAGDHDKSKARVQASILALAKPFRIGVEFSGDPRGETVKLRLPCAHGMDRPYANDFGGEGLYCVPTPGW